MLFIGGRQARFNLQVRDADRLRGMAEEQYLREIELPPRRGRILDRNGAELASTADVDSIYCNPRQLPDPRDAARKLARVLGLDRARAGEEAGQRRFFAWVKRKVTPDEVTAVQGAGAARNRVHARAAPLLSEPHAGGDGHGARRLRGERARGGRAGAGQALRGTTSSVQGMRDALGRDIAVEGTRRAPEHAGSDVVLTIDRYLTFITERALAAGAAEHHAKAAVAIMMDPRTRRGAGHGVGADVQPERAAGAPPRRAPATAPSPTRTSPARP